MGRGGSWAEPARLESRMGGGVGWVERDLPARVESGRGGSALESGRDPGAERGFPARLESGRAGVGCVERDLPARLESGRGGGDGVVAKRGRQHDMRRQ